jgi:hypothetical protein
VTEHRKKPPIGGALLEALFAYDHLTFVDASDIVNSLLNNGLLCYDGSRTNARSVDFDFKTPEPNELPTGFLSQCFSSDFIEIFIAFNWTLNGKKIELNLAFDLANSVVSLSCKEDFLWNNSEGPCKVDYESLTSFYEVCEQICEVQLPRRAAIGSEPCHAEDIRVGGDDYDFNFVHSIFFSEAKKKNLQDWYENVYLRRWEDSTRLD